MSNVQSQEVITIPCKLAADASDALFHSSRLMDNMAAVIAAARMLNQSADNRRAVSDLLDTAARMLDSFEHFSTFPYPEELVGQLNAAIQAETPLQITQTR